MALAWVLSNEEVSAAIVGANRPEQIEENVGAVGAELDSAAFREIDAALKSIIRR